MYTYIKSYLFNYLISRVYSYLIPAYFYNNTYATGCETRKPRKHGTRTLKLNNNNNIFKNTKRMDYNIFII